MDIRSDRAEWSELTRCAIVLFWLGLIASFSPDAAIAADPEIEDLERQLQELEARKTREEAKRKAEEEARKQAERAAKEKAAAREEERRRAEAADRQEAKDRERHELAGEFVRIEPGCFEMGSAWWESDRDNNDEEIHEVCITQPFELGRYEVTQAQWQGIMGENPSSFSDCGSDCPVENVSWNDVQEFIRKLNNRIGQHYRLPTEAEWEYACRSGGKDEKYCGGNDVDQLGWYYQNSMVTTHPVGQKNVLTDLVCTICPAMSPNGWKIGTIWTTTSAVRAMIPKGR